MEDAPATARVIDKPTTKPSRSAQAVSSNVHIFRTTPNGAASGKVRPAPAVTVVAPALGNAIFNACGARICSPPITAEAVKASMTA